MTLPRTSHSATRAEAPGPIRSASAAALAADAAAAAAAAMETGEALLPPPRLDGSAPRNEGKEPLAAIGRAVGRTEGSGVAALLGLEAAAEEELARILTCCKDGGAVLESEDATMSTVAAAGAAPLENAARSPAGGGRTSIERSAPAERIHVPMMVTFASPSMSTSRDTRSGAAPSR